jgi:hypothetical protein
MQLQSSFPFKASQPQPKEGPLFPSQPSLHELCQSLGLEQILPSDSDFASLEPRLQQLLFNGLQTENARLREVEKLWLQLKEARPHIDTQIYLSSTRIEPEDDEQQREFRRQWSYLTENAMNHFYDIENEGSSPELVHSTIWSGSDLVSQSTDSELRLCVHHGHRDSCRQERIFSCHVSSQLLLYRLTATFGMPPPREVDGYTSCWEVDPVVSTVGNFPTDLISH